MENALKRAHRMWGLREDKCLDALAKEVHIALSEAAKEHLPLSPPPPTLKPNEVVALYLYGICVLWDGLAIATEVFCPALLARKTVEIWLGPIRQTAVLMKGPPERKLSSVKAS